ncbi:MAG TPA: hypothetical protein VFJ16_17640 [Longimicrobium sp.]|nr:hypothetical protein [Longimicrobium sp.]
MRTLMKVTVPVEHGNAGIRDGRLPRTIEGMLDQLKPEAAYFYAEHGQRAALMVFDLQDPSQIPTIAEPLFQELNAAVEFSPVMVADELRRGLIALAESEGAGRIAAPPISPATV